MKRDHEIESLLRQAGARTTPSPDRTARVRAAAQDAWRAEVRVSRQRRWRLAGFGLLVAATALILITRPWQRVGPATNRIADVRTVGGSTTSMSLAGGGELRLADNTNVVLEAPHRIRLDRGTIYLDSQNAVPGGLVVVTPSGVVRDIGTRFEVHVDATGTRVRVREGAIELDRQGVAHQAPAGTELVVEGERISTRAIAPFDPAWNWITRAAPTFRIEGVSLDAFLKWAEREGGLTIDTSTLTPAMRAIKLHGSIAGLSAQEALANVLPTCGLVARVANGRVSIRSAQ